MNSSKFWCVTNMNETMWMKLNSVTICSTKRFILNYEFQQQFPRMKINLSDIFACGLCFDFENAPRKVSTFRRVLPQVTFLPCQVINAFMTKMSKWNQQIIAVFMWTGPFFDQLEYGCGDSNLINCRSVSHWDE